MVDPDAAADLDVAQLDCAGHIEDASIFSTPARRGAEIAAGSDNLASGQARAGKAARRRPGAAAAPRAAEAGADPPLVAAWVSVTTIATPGAPAPN